jgi:myo-inositol-1(or 4)-monophosphatase
MSDFANLSEALDTARAAADVASAIHREHSGAINPEDASSKGRADFVSITDFEAQKASIQTIKDIYPQHTIISEELPDNPQSLDSLDGPTWIIDPLDGTTNFLHGHPMHCSSVAFSINGMVVVGAVSCGPTGEKWWAAKSHGAWKNDNPIKVSNVQTFERSLIGTGFPFKKEVLIESYTRQLARMLKTSGGVRRGGSAALDLCYLAEGRFDGFWELYLDPWDFAAGQLIVQEAGGFVSRIEGDTLPLDSGTVLAANSQTMAQRLKNVIR